eukprot:2853964-Pyramimonas_sp.AAC.1
MSPHKEIGLHGSGHRQMTASELRKIRKELPRDFRPLQAGGPDGAGAGQARCLSPERRGHVAQPQRGATAPVGHGDGDGP